MPHILLGISGSISAYKTPELVRLFRKEGWDVTPILTTSATQFVAPLSLSTVSETETLTPEIFMRADIPHLKLAKSGDIFVGAPLSTNTLSKIASGRADDPVSATLSAFEGPRIFCPAMHTEMWEHNSTQTTIKNCQNDQTVILGPDRGDLASGDYGVGRLVDPRLIVLSVYAALSKTPRLDGKHIVITAGGTSEPIDPVRQISNLSTGRSGEILAHMASLLGAKVTLITTQPLQIPNPHLHQVIPVKRVEEMQEALQECVPTADRLYMAAAVSDFTVQPTTEKRPRSGTVTLELTATPDLLKGLQPIKGSTLFVGYCLQDDDLEAVALKKLSNKGLDHIVANRSDQIGKASRSATVYSSSGKSIHLDDLGLPDFSLALLRLR